MQYLNIMQKYERQYQGSTVPLNSTLDPANAVSTPVPKYLPPGWLSPGYGGRFDVRGYPAYPYGLSGRVTTFSPLLVEESAPSDFELVALGRAALTTTSVSGTS